MSYHVASFLIAIGVWWAATGIVFLVARRAEIRKAPVLIGVSLLAAASLHGLIASATMQTANGAYLAFFSALGIWAWHETTFLTGVLTGPSRAPCPPGLKGWGRFKAAFDTVRSHELAILATVLVLVWLLWDQPNRVGLWTFLLLWAMRISAKLNIFFGAPNSVSAMMPKQMIYLTSYFRTDHISPVFAVSVMTASAGLAWLAMMAFNATEPEMIVGFMLLATFMGLAIIEHLFLVLPVADSALWTWAVQNTDTSKDIKTRSPGGQAPKIGDKKWI